VPPFPGSQRVFAIETALRAPIATLYKTFDEAGWPPLDCAGARGHARDGAKWFGQVLRPHIHCGTARRHRSAARARELRNAGIRRRIRFPAREIVAEIESTLTNELDLQREGANASLLRRNFIDGNYLIVPDVHWSHTTESVLTLERVHASAVDDLAALDAAGIDRIALAKKACAVFTPGVS